MARLMASWTGGNLKRSGTVTSARTGNVPSLATMVWPSFDSMKSTNFFAASMFGLFLKMAIGLGITSISGGKTSASVAPLSILSSVM